MAAQSSESVACFKQNEENLLDENSVIYEETESNTESSTSLSHSEDDDFMTLDNEQENNAPNNQWIQVRDHDSDQPLSAILSTPTIFLVLLSPFTEILQHMIM